MKTSTIRTISSTASNEKVMPVAVPERKNLMSKKDEKIAELRDMHDMRNQSNADLN